MSTVLYPESTLVVLQGSSEDDHPGIVDGFRQAFLQGSLCNLKVVPFRGLNGAVRRADFWDEVQDSAAAISASLVVFHCYHDKALPDPTNAVQRLRSLPNSPFIVSTLGDAFMNGYFRLPSLPKTFLRLSAKSDLICLTAMGRVANKVAHNSRAPIMVLPLGSCQIRFPLFSGCLTPNMSPDFDVVFIGSRNASRNPLRPYAYKGYQRAHLVHKLTRRFGSRFALYGRGWEGNPSYRGPVSFHDQAIVAGRGRIIVGGIPFSRERYYTSNRPFIQMTSGSVMVDCDVPGVDRILGDRRHWILTPEDRIVDKIEEILSWDHEKCRKIGEAGARYVCERHTQADRVATLLENVRRLKLIHDHGAVLRPHLPFFLPNVDVCKEEQQAVLNWPC